MPACAPSPQPAERADSTAAPRPAEPLLPSAALPWAAQSHSAYKREPVRVQHCFRLPCACGKEGAEVTVTRCLCDFCVHLVKWGKYLFADFMGISVGGGQASLPYSPCAVLSLSFSLACSQRFLSSCEVVLCGEGTSCSGASEFHI